MNKLKKKSIVRAIGLIVFVTMISFVNGKTYGIDSPQTETGNEIVINDTNNEPIKESLQNNTTQDAPVVSMEGKNEDTGTLPVKQIENLKDLIDFRDAVNAGKTNLNAIIDYNTIFNEKKPAYPHIVIDEIVDKEKIKWKPIGTAENPYIGKFDGSYVDLVFSDSSFLFGYVGEGAVIENVQVRCPITEGEKGGICKYTENENQVTNCQVRIEDNEQDDNVYVVSEKITKGLCISNKGTINNCYYWEYKDIYDRENHWGHREKTLSPDTEEATQVEAAQVDDLSSGTTQLLSSKTSDTITPVILITLSGFMLLSLAGLWLLRKKKVK